MKQAIIPTAEEANQSTINPTDDTNMSVTPTADVPDNTQDIITPAPDTQEEPTNGLIDQVKKQELEEKFQTLINNPRYWENSNRIKRLEEALVLPVYDDRSMQQFYISAKEELIAAAMKHAITNRCIPVEPTEAEIMTLAEFKYDEKYVQEPIRKAEREAKKKKTA